MRRILNSINSPKDIKKLSLDELALLSSEIRSQIIKTVSKNGGHLAPNLGVVELTLALHYVFDSPKDKFIWDVGHQCYTHKLITGRKERFHTLRQFKGLSGFPKREESEHDIFNTGHASTSISSSLGICEALAKLNGNGGKKGRVLAIIGDGAMTGGLAFEGLNQAGHLKSNLIVIFNDNEMSIAPNVGALQAFISRKLTGEFSLRVRKEIKTFMKSIPSVGEDLYKLVKRADSMVKRLLTPGLLFEAFGFRYTGPIPGHDLARLIQTFTDLKDEEGPLLIHVTTDKGKGYQYSEENPELFHGIGPFDPENPSCKIADGIPTYTEVFGDTITELARKDKRIIAVTAAMRKGTGLDGFRKEFPDRFYDVGIAEQHATTFSAGLASQGLKPVFVVYSTFLQRAFDQILHDVCLQKLPITFAIDRAGIVGDDGSTHQGIFDLTYLRSIPNMTVMAPKDEAELKDMLYTSTLMNGPVSIRYPRGKGLGVNIKKEMREIPHGKGEIVYKDSRGEHLLIIAIGNMVYPSIEAARLLAEEGIRATVINARFVKPIDHELIVNEAKRTNAIITVEENVITGGFGSAVLETLSDFNLQKPFLRIGIPDEYVEHGSQKELRNLYRINPQGIFEQAVELLSKSTGAHPKQPAKKRPNGRKTSHATN
jgi:1-deoxy-D-xylulose-5-phosphate synthase